MEHGIRSPGARQPRGVCCPLKPAQIIINLAAGPESAQQNICDIPCGRPHTAHHLKPNGAGPFCGTGVLLQEALLGYAAYGTDIEKRMIDYSRRNLNWLTEKYQPADASIQLEQGDATNHSWSPPQPGGGRGLPGKPFTAAPPRDVLAQTMNECNVIIRKNPCKTQRCSYERHPPVPCCTGLAHGSKIMHLPLY